MIHKILNEIDQRIHFETVEAHCDIPCGIYDPHQAQIGALTVIRMVDLIDEHVKEHDKIETAEFFNSMTRYIAVKEEHAELVKHEIRVIWGDFIKESHLEEYPQLNGLVHKIMALASKARQTVDRKTAVALLVADQGHKDQTRRSPVFGQRRSGLSRSISDAPTVQSPRPQPHPGLSGGRLRPDRESSFSFW